MNNGAEGLLAEYEAGEYLEKEGYKIVGRNVNYPGKGELDIVAIKDGTFVIVEVKYRSSKEHGDPVESVTRTKVAKIIKATEMLIVERGYEDYDVRFDIIAVRDGKIEHIENAFYGYWY